MTKRKDRPPLSDKPFRDALRLESELAERGEPCTAKEGSLRWDARQLLLKGDVQTIRELADRLDGKAAQRLAGSDEDPPIQVAAATIDLSRFTEAELRTIEAAMTLLEGPASTEAD
jgi:hypothetical protein